MPKYTVTVEYSETRQDISRRLENGCRANDFIKIGGSLTKEIEAENDQQALEEYQCAYNSLAAQVVFNMQSRLQDR